LSSAALRYGAAILLVACGGLAARADPAAEAAQAETAAERPEKLIRFSASASPYYQGNTGLGDGAEFRLSILFTRFDVAMPVSRRTLVGLGISYDIHDYEFSGSPSLGAAQPWNDMRRIGLAFPIVSRVAESWVLNVVPSVNSFGESGSDFGESVAYGGTVAGLRVFRRDRSIGLGLGAFDQLEELFVFPFLAIKWNLTERLSLANPFRAGPTGPAGVELIYELGKQWRIAGGGAYRSARFRLSEQGAVPNGVGENTGIPLFARLQKQFGKAIRLDLYGGAVLFGKLRLEDESGNELASDDYDAAPLLALTLSGNF
jgi:hypothetical protein